MPTKEQRHSNTRSLSREKKNLNQVPEANSPTKITKGTTDPHTPDNAKRKSSSEAGSHLSTVINSLHVITQDDKATLGGVPLYKCFPWY